MKKLAYYLKRLSFVMSFLCLVASIWQPTNQLIIIYIKISISSLIAMVFFYVVEQNSTPFSK